MNHPLAALRRALRDRGVRSFKTTFEADESSTDHPLWYYSLSWSEGGRNHSLQKVASPCRFNWDADLFEAEACSQFSEQLALVASPAGAESKI